MMTLNEALDAIHNSSVNDEREFSAICLDIKKFITAKVQNAITHFSFQYFIVVLTISYCFNRLYTITYIQLYTI